MKLLPKNPHGARLADLFSYRWSWIEAPIGDATLDVAWKTNKKYPIKPRVLWQRWQDANSLIGVRFGKSTRYAMLDIDKNSDYIDAIGTIQGALETVGIVRTVPIRSSWSGGIHLYIPLPQSYPTFSVACLLQQTLEAQGFHLAPGQLEAFPNRKQYAKTWLGEYTEYNGHRLPLQPGTGSVVLDNDLNPLPGADSLALFFALWDNAVVLNDQAEISEALTVARASNRHRRRSTHPALEWREDLEQIIEEGWTGPGQTNELLKNIACYGVVFQRLKGALLAEYIEKTASSCPGYERWCNHQHEIHRRACQWGKQAEGFWWPLGDEPLRERHTFMDCCKERAAEARARIARAVREDLLMDQGLGVGELVKRITSAAKCSAQTLYKNKDLWHPDHITPAKAVNDDISSDITDPEEQLRLIREGLGTTTESGFTPKGGDNEVCISETLDLKKFIPKGREGGAGGEKGYPQPPQSTGWLPPMDWKEGPANA